jgi:hypothetical protein
MSEIKFESMFPDAKWNWWVFGKKLQLCVHLTEDAPIYRRIISTIVLGSEWERADRKG